MTVKLDLEMLDADDLMSIAGCARVKGALGLRDWLFQIAYQQAPQAPTCSSHLWGVSCGHTSCPLHGPWETKWAGKGASAERDEDFKRMVCGVGVHSPADTENENNSGVGGRSTQEHP